MVRFPLAGKPVRHIAGGLGNEEWPRTEERAENWASRQGYVVVRSSMVGAMSMVMMLVALIIASRKRRNHECCRSLQIVGDPHSKTQGKSHARGKEVVLIISICCDVQSIDFGSTIDINNR